MKNYDITATKLITKFSELIDSSEEKFNEFFLNKLELFLNLKKEVESLLPGATSAGLASAFNNARDQQSKNIALWRKIFYSAVAIMFLVPIVCIKIGIIKFEASMALQDVFGQAVKLLSLEFPLLWLGSVTNKKINQHTKLHEDYLHKWAVAQNFAGLRKQAAAISDKTSSKHLNALFSSFIIENATNPSHSLDTVKTTESPIQNIIDALSPKKQNTELKIDNSKSKNDNSELKKVDRQEGEYPESP